MILKGDILSALELTQNIRSNIALCPWELPHAKGYILQNILLVLLQIQYSSVWVQLTSIGQNIPEQQLFGFTRPSGGFNKHTQKSITLY